MYINMLYNTIIRLMLVAAAPPVQRRWPSNVMGSFRSRLSYNNYNKIILDDCKIMINRKRLAIALFDGDSNGFMDAMALAGAADTASNCRQKLRLRLHKIDIVRHPGHFVMKDSAMDTMDVLDIVRLDIAIAMMGHMLGSSMDWASDSHQMQMRNLSAAVGHSTVADMEAGQLLAMLGPVAVSMGTYLNGRSCDLIFQLNGLIWRPSGLVWRSSVRVLRPNGLFVVGTRIRGPRRRRDYFEWMPSTIAANGCREIGHFGCTLASIEGLRSSHPPVCGRPNSNRFERKLMRYCNCWSWCHCMESVGWIRRAQAKMGELHLAVLRRMQSILLTMEID